MHSITPGIAALALALGLAPAVIAYKDGPPPNMAGGFGGASCHMCHADNPLNAPGGSLRIAGLPETYQPGHTYRITVTLAREGLRVGGFQITARTAPDAMAGSWTVLDRDRTQAGGGFVEHTEHGTSVPAEGENRWEMEWTAPAAGSGAVVFNAAANASNDDASALGDYIYTLELRSSAQP